MNVRSCVVSRVRRRSLELRHCIGLFCFQRSKLIFQLLGFLVGAHLSSRWPELRPLPALSSSGLTRARRRCRVLSRTRHHPQCLVPEKRSTWKTDPTSLLLERECDAYVSVEPCLSRRMSASSSHLAMKLAARSTYR